MGISKPLKVLRVLAFALSPLIPVHAQQPDAAKIYSQSSKSVLLILVKSPQSEIVAQGTGFLVEGGRIVTNRHVVRDGVPLIDLGGVRIPAKIAATDDVNDLAILTIEADVSAEPLVLADRIPSPGSSVFAIGNPHGLEKSISSGVLSAVRTMGKRQLIQITTPISPGSSGGPVFDSAGKVIGVTVGSIEEGQNLNFAVPASAVIKLIQGGAQGGDFSSLREIAQALVDKRKGLTFSADADSPYQTNESEIRAAFSTAVDHAVRSDVSGLIELSNQFFESFSSVDRDIAQSAAERAFRLAPSSTSSLALAKTLDWQAAWMQDGAPKQTVLERAERVARSAISMSKQPDVGLYYWLGDILEMRGSYKDADATLHRALEMNHSISDPEQEASILRDLIKVAGELQHPADVDKWFSSLAQTGKAAWWDWEEQAKRLDARNQYGEAGEAWQTAAAFNVNWTDWCEAGGSFELSENKEDSVLSTARKCIELGTGKDKSDGILSDAHRAIAAVLNERGVYEEALSNSKEAVTLGPENAPAYNQEALALIGLRRFQEAINAAKQAIRLSDGKYGIMHFNLGSAYFETENWQFAEQSFEKAAQMLPYSDAAAYNVGLCFQRLGLYLDAARWYEEVLRRNPNRSDKQELLTRIAALRR